MANAVIRVLGLGGVTGVIVGDATIPPHIRGRGGGKPAAGLGRGRPDAVYRLSVQGVCTLFTHTL